jgi:hypothetical protein
MMVPVTPVKANVNSAVAIAAWIDSPAKALSAGISRMPPMPTAPISVPTAKAVASSQTRSGRIDSGKNQGHVSMPLGALPYRRTGRHPDANAVRLPVISAFNCFISR